MAGDVDVDELTSGLYASAPEEFVRVRAQGAKDLKAAGLSEAAAEFAKLSKPSVPAWIVNVLAHEHADVVEDVIERGEALRKAHVGGSGAADIRAAQSARNGAIDRAVDVAEKATGRTLSEGHRAEVAATLEAAATDTEAADEVRAGRLLRPLEAPTGFEAMGGLTVIRGGKHDRKPAQRGRAAPRDEVDDAESHRARLAVLEADAEHAARDHDAALETASRLRDRVSELEADRERLEQELKDVTTQLTAARKEAREAEREAAEAERRANRAAARVERST